MAMTMTQRAPAHQPDRQIDYAPTGKGRIQMFGRGQSRDISLTIARARFSELLKKPRLQEEASSLGAAIQLEEEIQWPEDQS